MRNFWTVLITVIVCFTQFKSQTISTDIRVDSPYAVKKTEIKNILEETTIIVGNGLISQPALASDLDIPGYDLINTSLYFKEDAFNQKVVFAPFKLLSREKLDPNKTIRYNWLTNLKFNANNNKDQITLGLTLFSFDNSIHNSKKSKRLLQNIFDKSVIPDSILNAPAKWKTAKDSTELWSSYFKKVEGYYEVLYEKYNGERTKHIFRTTTAYNIQLFPVLSSKDTAKISDFDSLNYYAIKSHVISPSLQYSYKNGKFNCGLTYNFYFSRQSAVKMQELIPYHGIAGNLSFRLFKLMKYKDLKKKDFYKKSLYIPAIHFGVAIENKNCTGDRRFVEKQAINQLAVTPFFDFYISPTNQFRIGVVYTNQTLISKKTFEVTGALLQYNFKLSSL